MKKILLLLMLFAVVNAKEKFTSIGDSKFPSSIMDTVLVHLNNNSKYYSRTSPGYGWQQYDLGDTITSNPIHALESYILADTTTYFLVELGLNNIWGNNIVANTYYKTQIDHAYYLDRWYQICKAKNVKLGIIEMSPVWMSTNSDTSNARILSEVKILHFGTR